MYVKRPLKFHEKLPTALSGIVYQLAPAKDGMVEGEMVDVVAKWYKDHPQEGHHSRGEIRKTVGLLIDLGYLVAIPQ